MEDSISLSSRWLPAARMRISCGPSKTKASPMSDRIREPTSQAIFHECGVV